MFWRLPFRPTSSLDTTIAKDDVTLAIVLDDDDIIQEGKTQNPKLSDFISIPKHLNELVQLITIEPSSKIDEKLRYKYPNIACELLCSNMGNISETLLCEYFASLTSFLDCDPPLNPLFSGFSCKVLNFLCRNKPNEFFNNFQIQSDILTKLLQHVGTSCCMDLILQLVTTGEQTPDFIKWLNEQKLIQSLAKLVSAVSTPDICYNASQTLLDIHRVEKECSIDTLDTLIFIQEMESEEVINQILSNIFMNIDGPSRKIFLQCGISLLQGLLQPSRSFDQMVYPDLSLPIRLGNCNIGVNSSLETLHTPKEVVLSQGGKNVLCLLSRGIFNFHNLLNDSPEIQFKGTPILGYRRLVIIKLLSTILQVSPPESHNRFILSGVLKTLLDLFISYPWNNFLHTQVENIVKTLFSPVHKYDGVNLTSREDCEQVNNEYRDNNFLSPDTFRLILIEGQIIEKILIGWETNHISQTSQGKRMGYMGHLTNITNKIIEVVQSDKHLSSIFYECIEEDLSQKWEQLVSDDLRNLNFKNESKMGGDSLLSNFIPLGDETPADPILHQGYTEYQLYTVATNFEDSFGIDDEIILEDVVFTPFSELDSFEFSINSDEEKCVVEAFVTMCKETIHLFNETDIHNDIIESPQSSDSDEWMSHPIERSSTYLKKLQISDIESDEDEDDEDHDNLVPGRIKSSCNESSDLIETHIIYTQTVDILKSQKNSLELKAVVLHQDNLQTIDQLNNSGLSWPLDDGTDVNSWAEFGPFSNISSSESKTEDMGIFDNLVDIKEVNLQDNSNSSSDEDFSTVQTVGDTNIVQGSLNSEENTGIGNNLFGSHQKEIHTNVIPCIESLECVDTNSHLSDETFWKTEIDTFDSADQNSDTPEYIFTPEDTIDDKYNKIAEVDLNDNNNSNYNEKVDNLNQEIEGSSNVSQLDDYVCLKSLGLLYGAEQTAGHSLIDSENLPQLISTPHSVGNQYMLENIDNQFSQTISPQNTPSRIIISFAHEDVTNEHVQYPEHTDLQHFPK